jgi:hypothetical protein
VTRIEYAAASAVSFSSLGDSPWEAADAGASKQPSIAGQTHLVEMRQALEDLQRSGTTGLAGLGARHIADLDAVVADMEAAPPIAALDGDE